MKTFSKSTLKEYMDLTLSGRTNSETIIEGLINYITNTITTNGLTLSDYADIEKFSIRYQGDVADSSIMSQGQVNSIVDLKVNRLTQTKLDVFPVYVYQPKPLWAFLRNCAAIHTTISSDMFIQTVIQYLISYGDRFLVTIQSPSLVNLINQSRRRGAVEASKSIIEQALVFLRKLLESDDILNRVIRQGR